MKSIILITLLIAATLLLTTQAQVTIQFTNDYLVRNAYNIIEITTTGVNLAETITFTAQQSKADFDAKAPISPYQYQFVESNTGDYSNYFESPLIGATSSNSCIDITTKQIVGTISFSSTPNIFTFDYISKSNWVRRYTTSGPFPTMTFQCLMSLDTAQKVTYTNLYTTYYMGPNTQPLTESDIDLALPTRGFITPHIEFKSLSFKSDTPTAISTTAIEFEFSTTGGLSCEWG